MKKKLESVKTEPMQVENMTFLLERLGSDCDPLQFLRELTVNSIEAITKLGKSPQGEIVWDLDIDRFHLDGTYKLSIVDNGIGMTGPEMVQYINHLSASTGRQSSTGNFGVGAKIAAATRNPAGLIYLSWKDGEGTMVHLWKSADTGTYGLRSYPINDAEPDSEYATWLPIEDTLKPEQIKKHGTKVVLLGQSESANTMLPPEGTPKNRWIARYLNSRFFKFPPQISIKVREGWNSGGKDCDRLRSISGAEDFLENNKTHSGSVALDNATVHWWILHPDHKTHSLHLGGGTVAALFQNELYETKSGRSGASTLQSFGILLGHQRVVVYVEPDATALEISSNTARAKLLTGGVELPWADWAHAFRTRLPVEITELIAQASNGDENVQHQHNIAERLRSVDDLYRIPKYKPMDEGNFSCDEPELANSACTFRSSSGLSTCKESSGSRSRGSLRTYGGDVYALFKKPGGNPSRCVEDRLNITTKWVSETELGISDRAAHFIPESDTLLINKDFRVFTAFIDRWKERYNQTPAAAPIITEVIKEWFQQILMEVIYSVEFFRGERAWTDAEIMSMLSDESLTAAVLPRYNIEVAVRKCLSAKLGSLNADKKLA